MHKTEGKAIRATSAEGSGHLNPSQLSLKLNPNVGSQNLRSVLHPSNCSVLIFSINKLWIQSFEQEEKLIAP